MSSPGRAADGRSGDDRVAAELSPETHLQRLLDVEAALADAQASVGLVPARCAEAIRAAAQAHRFDRPALVAEAARAGTIVIPLVRALAARVAQTDGEAARYVHWGATSQDILDTALVLQLDATVPMVGQHLTEAGKLAAGLARRFVDTPLAGRTWLQQATPTTFGLKAAGWVDALARTRGRLEAALDDTRVLQLGGATGTLAALGAQGPAVAEALARGLGLRLPDLPWHAHRDRLAHLAGVLGVSAGTTAKIGRDLALLAQTEVGEAAERADLGRGGSSTMPHKRNPVAAALAVTAGVRAPGLVATMLGAMMQEHERGLGGWQAEWDTLPELVRVAAAGARAVADALDGLVVDPARMRANLETGGGLGQAEAVTMALAARVGKPEAHACIEQACRRAVEAGRSLGDVLETDPLVTRHLDPRTLAACLDPASYLGSARWFVDRVLSRRREDPA